MKLCHYCNFVGSHFAGFIASILVFIKACERSEPATPTLVATSTLRLLLVSFAGSSSSRLASLAHLAATLLDHGKGSVNVRGSLGVEGDVRGPRLDELADDGVNRLDH